MAIDMNDPTLPGESRVDLEVETESATTKPQTDEEKAESARQEKILALLKKRWKTWTSATSQYRKDALDDQKFRVGTWNGKSTQWEKNIEERRDALQLPTITINRMPGFIRQVTNSARQADLRIHVNPVNDKSDPKIAETIQSVIRNIETQSFADRAYNKGADKQAENGRGAFRITTEWANQKDFFQRIRIKQEKNPLQIAVDLANGDEPQWAMKPTDIDADEFKDVTGEDAPDKSAIAAFTNQGDESGDWFPNGKIRLMEYFSLEDVPGGKKRIAQLSDGTIIDYPDKDQLKRLAATNAAAVAKDQPVVTILNDRWIRPKQMAWRKCTALKVYEETIWPADMIPWIFVIGEEYEVEGQLDWRGVVRDAKAPARVYNAEVTALIERVSLGQKAPVVGVRGQFGPEGSAQRAAWAKSNIEPVAFLEYDNVDYDGKPAGRPEKATFEAPLEGVLLAIKQTDEDYKSTAGFRDASLGERGPQESGVAIKARQQQDEHQSSHYLDNLRFALCMGGRLLIQLIRVVYSTPQIIRITGDDDKERQVMVFAGAHKDPRNPEFLDTHQGPSPLDMGNGQMIQAGEKIPFQLPKGVTEIYDLSLGEYDIEVSAGKNQGTRRQEAEASIMELFKGFPPEISVKFLDLLFQMADFPMARQMTDRAKKMLPPEMQDQGEGGEGGPEIPPQVAAKMAAMQQQFAQLQQAYQEAKQALDTKAVEAKRDEQLAQMNNESKERIEAMRAETAAFRLAAESKSDRLMAALEAQLEHIRMMTEHRNDLRGKVVDAALAPPPPEPAAPEAAGAGA